MGAMWSNTDFPYMCLKDRARTLAFRQAIHEVVRPGDIVVDAGAGSGILSFFAAEAGAHRVYAVEIDPLLVSTLRRSIALNGFDGTISVVAGSITTVALPHNIDVFIGELIDTALMDEMQVAAVNALRARGVLGDHTRMIPQGYSTFVELVRDDTTYYGFRIAAPKHEWPFYACPHDGWCSTSITPLTDKAIAAFADFRAPVEPMVATRVTLCGLQTGLADSLRLSGLAHLTSETVLGPTNALNGEKVLRLERDVEVDIDAPIELCLRYGLGASLDSFRCSVRSGRDIACVE